MRRPVPARRLYTLPLLALALALPLAACGDDGEEETAATVTASAATTATAEAASAAATTGEAATAAATTAEATTAEAAEGALAAALLTAADLPAGFEETPYESDAKDCLGPLLDPLAAAMEEPNAFSGDGGASEARSRAWAFAGEDEARTAFAEATGEGVRTCVVAGAEETLKDPEYEPGGSISDEPLELAPVDGADEVGGHRYLARITPAGATEEIAAYSDVVLARAGSTIVAFQFLTLGEPFAQDATATAVAGSVGRAAAGS